MKSIDLWKLAATNLKRRKTRTFLTVTGIMIGTACIILMLSIGLSNYQQFKTVLEENTALTQIEIYSTDDTMRGGLTDSALTAIQELPEVTAVSPIVEVFAVVRTGNYQADILLYGINSEVLDLNYEQGGTFSGQENMPELIIGGQAAKQFVTEDAPLSGMSYEQQQVYEPQIDWLNAEYTLMLGYDMEGAPQSSVYRVKVAGVTKNTQSQYSNQVYIDLQVLKQMLIENKEYRTLTGTSLSEYSRAVVRVETIDQVEGVLGELQKRGYQAYAQSGSILQIQEERSQQQMQLLAIGSISLLVSAISIANTMYANILERQSDIGIMKIIGMKTKQIQRLFLTESLIIGGFGGVLGAVLSYIVVTAINVGVGEGSFLGMQFQQGLLLEVPMWLTIAAIVIAAMVGMVAGIYPAHQAAKMSPMEALRRGE